MQKNDSRTFLKELGLGDFFDAMNGSDDKTTSLRGGVIAPFEDGSLLSGAVYLLSGDEYEIVKRVARAGDDALFVSFEDVAERPEGMEAVHLNCVEAVSSLYSIDLCKIIVLSPGMSLRLSDPNRPMLAHALQWLRISLSEQKSPPAVIILDPHIEGSPSPANRTIKRFSDLVL